MTDRANAITVVFEHDFRVDDAQSILNAIMMVKGVLSATLNVTEVQSHIAYMRARHDLQSKLWDVLKEK